MRLPALLLSLALVAPVAPAGAASPEKVDALIVEMKIEQNFVQVRQIMMDAFEQGVAQAAKQRGLSDAQLARIRPELDALRDTLAEGFSWQSMAADFRQVYAEELTDEEVDAALAYYRSPAGASLLAKMPVLMQRGAEIGQRRAQALMPELMRKLEATVDDAATP
jgi:uncharacterized protein